MSKSKQQSTKQSQRSLKENPSLLDEDLSKSKSHKEEDSKSKRS
jgi:hypothetical protein